MGDKRLEELLWFEHQDGRRLHPWQRRSSHHGMTAFWVSDGSNLIENAEAVETIDELIVEIFERRRSVWLHERSADRRSGLYRWGERALSRWGSVPELAPGIHGAIDRATRKAGPAKRTVHAGLPPALQKALRDAGFESIAPADGGGYSVREAGALEAVWLKPAADGVYIELPAGDIGKLGILPLAPPEMGTSSVGHVPPERLGDILHAARVLLANSPAKLGAAWEARLASVSTTERTREVRQRVGQELFREALLSLWNGRCAISGHRLPPRLLRASHAKPWAASDDVERLDPFNGLLLAVHYDALFDTGMISVADSGKLLVDPRLDQQTRRAFGLESGLVVAGLMPGHHHYLDYHRRHVAAWI